MLKIAGTPRGSVFTLQVLVACSLFLIGLTPSARADTVYTYIGQPYTNISGDFACPLGPGPLPLVPCGVAGSFTVPQPLAANLVAATVAPTSFSFTDGILTPEGTIAWTDSTSPTSGFEIFTDPSGNIIQWNIALSQSVSGVFLNISTENLGGALANDFSEEEVSVGGNPFVTGLAKNAGMPGTWTMSTTPTVPEPGSLALLGTGLLAIIRTARRKWHS